MKKLLIALAAVLVTAASYAQGTLNFNTRDTGIGLNAPVVLSTGGGPGPSYSAALYLVGAGGSLTLVPGSTTTFRTGANAALLQYINPVVVEIPGTAVGGSATVRMRAWETAGGSYEAALNKGESVDLTVTGLGGGAVTPANLPSSFTGFTIPVIPEPSTIALGVLGAAALLLRRRK